MNSAPTPRPLPPWMPWTPCEVFYGVVLRRGGKWRGIGLIQPICRMRGAVRRGWAKSDSLWSGGCGTAVGEDFLGRGTTGRRLEKSFLEAGRRYFGRKALVFCIMHDVSFGIWKPGSQELSKSLRDTGICRLPVLSGFAGFQIKTQPSLSLKN